MEVFHAFGIDWRLLIIQAVNFGVLMFLLWIFLYKPLMKLLDDRTAVIAKGVDDAHKAGESLANAESTKQTIITAAQKNADEIAERVRRDAAARDKQAQADAEAKAARILLAAEKESEELRARALHGAKEEMAKLIVLGAEKALRKN